MVCETSPTLGRAGIAAAVRGRRVDGRAACATMWAGPPRRRWTRRSNDSRTGSCSIWGAIRPRASTRDCGSSCSVAGRCWRGDSGRRTWIVTLAEPGSSLGSVDLDAADPARSLPALARTIRSGWCESPAPTPSRAWFSRVASSTGSRAGSDHYNDGAYPRWAMRPEPCLVRRDLFSPFAIVTGQEGGKVILTARLPRLHRRARPDRSLPRGPYLPRCGWCRFPTSRSGSCGSASRTCRSKPSNGPSASSPIVSPYLDPLSKRDPRPHRFVALGLKPGDSPSRLRFVTKPDKGPAAGFTLTARLVPDGLPAIWARPIALAGSCCNRVLPTDW